MNVKRTSAGKSNRKKIDVNTPVEDLGPNGRVAHYNAILLESVNSKMDQVIEGVDSFRVSVDQKIGGLRDEMNGRFDIVEAAIRMNSQDIRGLKTDVSTLKTDVRGIKSEMHEMETRLSAKIDRITDRVDNHEERISTLEAGRST